MAAQTPNQVKPWSITFVLLGTTLGLFSYINLLGQPEPLALLNTQIVTNLASAAALPADQRIKLYMGLREQQEKALAGKPSEPFAWARLSYLRLATDSNKTAAFEALRLSDLISPHEPRQLPERALMWRQFHQVQTTEQQAYQDVLWQNAYRLQPDATWQIAVRSKITDEVGEALKRTDPELHEQWQARIKEQKQR